MGVAVTGEGDVSRSQSGLGDADDLGVGIEPGEAGDEVSSGWLYLRPVE
jgi:C4-type Zn-finger protein